MLEKAAKITSVIFHPVLIPTLGFILLFNSGFYFSFLPWEAKRFVLLVLFFTTGILPMLSVAILALNRKYDVAMKNSSDRVLPLLLSSVFYYLGYLLLSKIKAYPVFNIFMLAAVLVIVVLMVVSLKWKISTHMAAIGSITAAFFSLSFRTGINPVWAILLMVLLSGIVGTARIIAAKHSIWEIFTGYITGFLIIYLVIYFA